jgi:hypothetical protein
MTGPAAHRQDIHDVMSCEAWVCRRVRSVMCGNPMSFMVPETSLLRPSGCRGSPSHVAKDQQKAIPMTAKWRSDHRHDSIELAGVVPLMARLWRPCPTADLP